MTLQNIATALGGRITNWRIIVDDNGTYFIRVTLDTTQ